MQEILTGDATLPPSSSSRKTFHSNTNMKARRKTVPQSHVQQSTHADGRRAEIGWRSVLSSLGGQQKGEESLQLVSCAVCSDETRAHPHKPSSEDKVMTGCAGLEVPAGPLVSKSQNSTTRTSFKVGTDECSRGLTGGGCC